MDMREEADHQALPGKTAKRRKLRRLVLVTAIVAIAGVFLFLPVVPATVPGGIGPGVVHFTESPSCLALGLFWPIGIYSWQGQTYFGCLGPEVT